jgi:hypothetical protein
MDANSHAVLIQQGIISCLVLQILMAWSAPIMEDSI